jgi:hypothetical protein
MDNTEVVQKIAAQLNETQSQPLEQLTRLAEVCGASALEALLQQTMDLEAQGGMMTESGKRRRTPGGVFFYLARQRLTPEQINIVFPPKPKPVPPPVPLPPAPETEPEPPPPPPATSITISPDTQQFAARAGIIDMVGLEIIERALRASDKENLLRLMDEARAMLQEGGLEAPDGSSLRKLSDIFIYLAFACIPVADRQTLPRPSGHRITPRPTPPTPPKPRVEKGATIKMTIIGRPRKIDHYGEYVALTFLSGSMPALPQGLPPPPMAGPFVALIAMRQWRRIENALNQPEDSFILEGYGAVEPQQKFMMLFVTNAMTKLQQRARAAERSHTRPPHS